VEMQFLQEQKIVHGTAPLLAWMQVLRICLEQKS